MSTIRPALVLLGLLTLLTGVAYPCFVTVAAQLLFPAQAHGSLLWQGRTLRGSRLIGQPFSDAKYFWSRPSATAPTPYNAAASSGSNQGPLHLALASAVEARIAKLHALDPENGTRVPVDLVTASASGLDPHISPAAALYQLERIARARGSDVASLRELVELHTEGRVFGLLGEPRVRVLELNLALDHQDLRHTRAQ